MKHGYDFIDNDEEYRFVRPHHLASSTKELERELDLF